MLSRLITRREQAILGGLSLAIIVGAVVIVFKPSPGVPVVAPSVEVTAPQPTPEFVPVPEMSPKIGVAIVGAVQSPGLYYLEQGEHVRDLIQMAGGLMADANTDQVHTDAPLHDATTIEIPTGGEDYEIVNSSFYMRSVIREPEPLSAGLVQPGAGLININLASSAELQSLHGIGPALASRIIAYRQVQFFQSVEDLKFVSGIGDKKLESIRHRITAP